jgi:hypothetical protein
MILHHLPGGHGHDHHAAVAVEAQSDAQQSHGRTDRAEAEK